MMDLQLYNEIVGPVNPALAPPSCLTEDDPPAPWLANCDPSAYLEEDGPRLWEVPLPPKFVKTDQLAEPQNYNQVINGLNASNPVDLSPLGQITEQLSVSTLKLIVLAKNTNPEVPLSRLMVQCECAEHEHILYQYLSYMSEIDRFLRNRSREGLPTVRRIRTPAMRQTSKR